MAIDPVFGDFDLRNAAADGMEEAVAWYTVGVVSDNGTGLGTASAILWRSHILLLTARHLIGTTAPENLFFFFRPGGTLDRHNARELQPGLRLPTLERIRVDIQQVHTSSLHDLIVLDVTQTQLEGTVNVQFFEEIEQSSTPDAGQVVVLMGFPADLGRPVQQGGLAAFRSVEWTQIEEPIRIDDFDPQVAFLLRYQSADEGRAPHGFSGAGVWYRTNSPTVWHPNLRLAGVVTKYYPRLRLLESVRIEVVKEFLEEIFSR